MGPIHRAHDGWQCIGLDSIQIPGNYHGTDQYHGVGHLPMRPLALGASELLRNPIASFSLVPLWVPNLESGSGCRLYRL